MLRFHLLNAVAICCFGCLTVPQILMAEDSWLIFEGKQDVGTGKHVVLVSGDEEYRSEESLPMLQTFHVCSR